MADCFRFWIVINRSMAMNDDERELEEMIFGKDDEDCITKKWECLFWATMCGVCIVVFLAGWLLPPAWLFLQGIKP